MKTLLLALLMCSLMIGCATDYDCRFSLSPDDAARQSVIRVADGDGEYAQVADDDLATFLQEQGVPLTERITMNVYADTDRNRLRDIRGSLVSAGYLWITTSVSNCDRPVSYLWLSSDGTVALNSIPVAEKDIVTVLQKRGVPTDETIWIFINDGTDRTRLCDVQSSLASAGYLSTVTSRMSLTWMLAGCRDWSPNKELKATDESAP